MFLIVVSMWTLIAFLAGALPFSVWIGRGLLGVDIRRYGDANPGATNVLRAGGRATAALALLLDFLKGAVPVAIAHVGLGFTGWALVAVALAPPLGHAFSPFLGGRGGKAVATTGGIWCGLTLWEGQTIGGILLGIFVYLFGANGWAVVSAMGGLLIYFLGTHFLSTHFMGGSTQWNIFFARPALVPTLLAVWLGNLLLLIWTHRLDLAHPPRVRLLQR